MFDLSLRLRVYLLMEAIHVEGLSIEELSPGVRSLQIRFDSRHIRQDYLMRQLQSLDAFLQDVDSLTVPTRTIHLPMSFEDSATLGAVSRKPFVPKLHGFPAIQDFCVASTDQFYSGSSGYYLQG